MTTVRSKAAMASATWSTVIGPSPNTRLNASTYPGMRSTVRIMAWCVLPISIGFWIGPLACSSSDGARPSQNWSGL